MTSASVLSANSSSSLPRSLSALLRIFLKETKYEFLKLFRTRSFSLAVVGFPVMFYLLFGVANKHVTNGNVHIAKYMLGGYVCFGLVGAALFGIGVGLASERSAGWLELKRSSPMPPMAYLVAKCVTAMAFGIIIAAVLIAVGTLFGGVHLSAFEIVRMLGLTAICAIPFAAMGLLLALTVPANAASGIVNLIYLPMSFVSGLWIPIQFLPRWLQGFAPVFPTYHMAQLMQGIFGYQDHASMTSHWSGLLGFTLIMMGACWMVFQRAEQNN